MIPAEESARKHCVEIVLRENLQQFRFLSNGDSKYCHIFSVSFAETLVYGLDGGSIDFNQDGES